MQRLAGLAVEGVEDDVGVAAERLGDIHRGVGMPEQQFLVVAMLGIGRAAEAGADEQFVAVDRHRLADDVDDLVGDDGDRLGPAQIRRDDHEFVAAQPRHRVHLAHRHRETGGRLAQDDVADLVAERIVDLLEAVEIDEDQREAARVAARLGHRLLQAIVEQEAVR